MRATTLFGTNTTIQISVALDDGLVNLSDYQFFPNPIDTFTYGSTGFRSIDVTAAVNAVLPGNTLVFQFQNVLDPFAPGVFVAQGVRFIDVNLEIVPIPAAIWLFAPAFGLLNIGRLKAV